jgi:carbamoyltransferase
MIILGISCFYHDSAACIVKDGKVVAAAQEERFTRKKHDNGFPQAAITFCLDFLGIAMNDVDVVAFYEKPILKFERILHQHLDHFPQSYRSFVNSLDSWLTQKLEIKKLLRDQCHYHGKIVFLPHHLSHAASTFYLSPFKQAVIVTLDGVGEWATTTIGTGKSGKITIDKEIHFPHSLGLLYSTLTAYLGFKVNNDEYKVMGLAAYGNPEPFMPQIDQLIKVFADGSFALTMKYFDYTWSDHMPSSALEKLFGHPSRRPESKVFDYHENIAAALQKKLELVVFNLLKTAYRTYKQPNLCLAGGVALNSVMNGKVLKQTPFKKIYVTPDPGDGGGALGAALYATQRLKKIDLKRLNQDFYPALGPAFSPGAIRQVLRRYHLKFTALSREKLLERVVNLLIRKKIIGWFQGRMEWGPRALGNRSILASAATEGMRDIINAKVKHREMFRPFAPVVLEKNISSYFEADTYLSPSVKYMLMVYPFKARGKKEVPATVHVDGSGRLQSIARSDNPLYYDLIDRYGQKTGTPIIINTSFNIRGEPIVCSPEDAVQCFLGTEIDYLVIDHFIVRKR